MTLEELEQACDDAEARGRDEVQLVVPRMATGNNIRLAGRYGPLSNEIGCVTEHNGTVAWWDIKKVRAFVRRVRREILR